MRTLKSRITDLVAIPGDVSPREYYRGKMNGQSVILMQYPNVNNQTREELENFIKIADWLKNQKVKAPEILQHSKSECAAIIEDLGASSFGSLRATNPQHFYSLATETLVKLKNASPPKLKPYKETGIYTRRRQLIDYFAAYQLGKRLNAEEFLNVWAQIESSLPQCPQGFVHGDYHLENMIYTANQECALIDFQDAFIGPLPYDLLNLLEDARVDVPQDIRNAMISKYCKDIDNKDTFMNWYHVLSAQFHGRVLGLFIMLAAEQGRDKYLIHIPRLQNYMYENLKNPVLKPLKDWFDKQGLDFKKPLDLDGNHTRTTFENLK